jgi:hypothetical protein
MSAFLRIMRTAGITLAVWGAVSIGVVTVVGSRKGVPSDGGLLLGISCILLTWLLWVETSRLRIAYLVLLSLCFGVYGFFFAFDRVFLHPSSLSGIDFVLLALAEFLLLTPILGYRIWVVRKGGCPAQKV